MESIFSLLQIQLKIWIYSRMWRTVRRWGNARTSWVMVSDLILLKILWEFKYSDHLSCYKDISTSSLPRATHFFYLWLRRHLLTEAKVASDHSSLSSGGLNIHFGQGNLHNFLILWTEPQIFFLMFPRFLLQFKVNCRFNCDAMKNLWQTYSIKEDGYILFSLNQGNLDTPLNLQWLNTNSPDWGTYREATDMKNHTDVHFFLKETLNQHPLTMVSSENPLLSIESSVLFL